ncbi:HEAT repeat domain-containing protein [Coleofasciculus chthonoplastes]|uniref:HEAT repeat domain-containing protein n=1 Tax=Coleofasciculus chthonoplastes TaxID=64178 RepID=UPI0032FBCA80
MNKIENLIENVKKNDAEASASTSSLVQLGVTAVPSIISAMRESSTREARNLRQVIFHINNPEIVPLMIPLLNEENTYLRSTAFKMLGKLKDRRALQPLINQLMDVENLESARTWAANALGELQDSQAIEQLLRVVEQTLEQDELKYHYNFVISTIVALAKLGDQQKASLIISLAREEDSIIRIEAVKALKHIVAPGLFSVLKEALHDQITEIRRDAMDAMFYLGVKEVIRELIFCVEDENSDLSQEAIYKLHGLTGEGLDDNQKIEELEKWWDEYKNELVGNVCYRLCQPIWLPNVIKVLENNQHKPNKQSQLIQELYIITGKNFAEFSPKLSVEHDDLNSVVVCAKTWWQQEGNRFEPGCLYKYGQKQDIHCIL